jgi:protein phosphatase
MGTTMVAVLHHKKATVMANVGDSRIYTLNGSMNQITMDHTLVQEWINQGRLSEKDAKIHPQRSILTNVLAILPQAIVDLFELEDEVSLILCCSDGLHGYVEDDEIEAILNNHDDLDVKTNQLITLANAKGGYDNTTVVLMAL